MFCLVWGRDRRHGKVYTIYLDEAGFGEIEGEDEDLGRFDFLLVVWIGRCKRRGWTIKDCYHDC